MAVPGIGTGLAARVRRIAAPLLATWLSASLAHAQVENATADALVIHVAAPDRAVGFGDGSRAKPFARLADALERVRKVRAAERAEQRPPQRIEVQLAPASYELPGTLALDGSLSGGGPQSPTVLRGVPPGTELHGARTVPRHRRTPLPTRDPRRARVRHERVAERVLVVDLRSLDLTVDAFVPRGMGLETRPAPIEPILGGRLLRAASWPDEGFASTGRVRSIGTTSAAESPGATFEFRSPRIEDWALEPNACIFAYPVHDWADTTLPIAHIDPIESTIRLAFGHAYGMKEGARFRIVYALCELDLPGEYWLDAERHELLYLPFDDQERGVELRLTAVADALVYVEGAQHLAIEGVEIGSTRGVGVRIAGGAHVALRDCTIRATGSHGAVVRGEQHLVERCRFLACGGSGVTLEGGDRRTLRAASHLVADCEFVDFSRLERTYRPGVAIAGVGHSVVHNRFHDAPHAAILFAGNEHRIEANEIFRVLTETADCGAIYGGRDWAMHGTVIRHNYIHDLPGTRVGGQNAIYLDDMASGVVVDGNVIERCTLGMLLGGGRDLLVRGNVFTDCGEALRFDARGVGWMAPQIADPSASTLHARLREIDASSEPWRSRYPRVRDTLELAFGRPHGSRIEGNALLRTPFGWVEDRESVRVENNRSVNGLESGPDRSLVDTRSIPGFAAIPFGRVGPRPRPR
ncbi:MAG: right-handed parallel beta-helix repeat-containing protein [Planctomycetota bacterium]